MKKEIAFAIVIVLFFCLMENAGNAAGPTTISLTPANVRTLVSHSLTLNLSIGNVTDMYLWVATIQWNSTVLNLTSYSEGSFLKQGGQTTFIVGKFLPGKIEGLTCSLVGNIPGVSGNGTLAAFEFNSTNIGTTAIEITFSDLLNSSGESIPHNRINGTVAVTVPSHDVSLVDVKPLKTVVGQGYAISINATVQDEGDYAESFNVTAYANTSNIGSENVTLLAGDATTATLSWNTTGFVKGNYTISAYAWPITGEANTTNNNCTDGVVHVGVPGNVNYFDGSRMADMIDMWLIQKHYGAIIGEPRYVPDYDVDGNRKIDMIDLWTVQKHFGQTEP